jgi:hypothetical protein
MKSSAQIFSTAAVIATLLSHSASLLAGAADVRSSDGGSMKFEYAGTDKLRINMADGANYMVVKENQIYVVADNEGQIMVFNMNQAMSMFGGMASSATPQTVEGKLLSLKATGRSETVAGIKGEVYMARFIDHEGEERTTDMVLARDPRAVDLQRAMFGMVTSMAKSSGKETKGADEMQQKLMDMNMGVLRYGEDMWVTTISDRKIDDARFVLPAEPTDMSALGGIFGGGGGGNEGGFMSGIMGALGGKAERQEDRVGNKAEQEVDKQTDNAVDNALNKAFGKLFGK